MFKMGLNKLLSLSKTNVVAESSDGKEPKNINKLYRDREKRKDLAKNPEILKSENGKKELKPKSSRNRTDVLWNTLKITNRSKNESSIDQNRLSGSNASSPKTSTLRPQHSSIAAHHSPSNNRNATVILEKSTKPLRLTSRCTENDNNNSKKLVNKNTNLGQKSQLTQQTSFKTQLSENNLMHANKSAAALGVLVQYLAFNLEAFSCPSLKKAHQKATKELLDIKQSCQTLEERLADKEEHFSKRESELQYEISKVEICLSDAEREARLRIEALETEILLKNKLNEERLRVLREAERNVRQQQDELQSIKNRENELLSRIEALSCRENDLREKVHTSEMEFSERLQLKDKEMAELTKQMDEARIQSNCDRRDLEDKLNLSQDELAITRIARSTNDASTPSKTSINLNRTQILEEEVESLRCVLELKQSEISELRKNNQEYLETIEHLEVQNIRYSTTESRLQMQLHETTIKLQAKQDEEKEHFIKIRKLEDLQKNETKRGNRLSLHNEELLWKLNQNSEKYSRAISELSKSYHEQSSFLCSTKSNGSIQDSIDGSEESHEGPTSPIIKGIVEKSDSISWMLEMDHETPEALASRLVRRAGSFRSDKCSPSPVPKRQKCQNNTSIQQSSSATLISRQNSEPSPQKLTPSGRSRSKSVSNQKTPEPIMTKSLIVPLCASSPHVVNVDQDESLVKEDFFLEDPDVPFSRSRASTFNSHSTFEFESAAQYMKCRDTTPLKRSEMKKLRRPKIGAGEAMISGSNSESEVSSGATSATSTAPSSPSLCSEQQKIASETFMLKCKSWNDDGPNESHV